MAYSKLHSSIVNSSLWGERDAVRILFITLLALCDSEGIVYGSKPGLSRIANIKPDESENAWSTLMSPDPDSSDKMRAPEHEGRRIEEVPGGFRLLNYSYYRGLRNDEDRREQNRKAQEKFKAKVSHGKPRSAEVSRGKPRSAQAEAEAETEAEDAAKPARMSSEKSVASPTGARARGAGLAGYGIVGPAVQAMVVAGVSRRNMRHAADACRAIAESGRDPLAVVNSIVQRSAETPLLRRGGWVFNAVLDEANIRKPQDVVLNGARTTTK